MSENNSLTFLKSWAANKPLPTSGMLLHATSKLDTTSSPSGPGGVRSAALARKCPSLKGSDSSPRGSSVEVAGRADRSKTHMPMALDWHLCAAFTDTPLPQRTHFESFRSPCAAISAIRILGAQSPNH